MNTRVFDNKLPRSSSSPDLPGCPCSQPCASLELNNCFPTWLTLQMGPATIYSKTIRAGALNRKDFRKALKKRGNSIGQSFEEGKLNIIGLSGAY